MVDMDECAFSQRADTPTAVWKMRFPGGLGRHQTGQAQLTTCNTTVMGTMSGAKSAGAGPGALSPATTPVRA